MPYGTLLKINGVDVRDPSEFQWDLYDLSSEEVAGRSESGYGSKDIVAQKRKLNCKWAYLSFDDASDLLKASVGGNPSNPNPYISVQYFDLMTKAWRTMEAMVGDRTVPIYNSVLEVVENVAFNIIER